MSNMMVPLKVGVDEYSKVAYHWLQWNGCNVLCCNTAINAMNRTLNTDMVTISFTPDIFQPALVNYSKARGSDCPMQLQWC